ncbi:hypothetical protein PR002_g26119 [Phytophthora rubi]|uniref:Uncharacterized protein n=1 Tax=Phytophthora rubi TaxID=129364 RepID=A0A6A3I0K3_9STRA|nr:hypothetical protein PR002_g26119 [Phytophthora rubi]
MRQKQRIHDGEHKVKMLKSSENWFEYVNDHTADHGMKDVKIREVGCNERGDDLMESSSRLQKDDESDIKSVVEELPVSQKFAKKKVVYSVLKPHEKEMDTMPAQIRSLLRQLAETFELRTSRLLEEKGESLHHAFT